MQASLCSEQEHWSWINECKVAWRLEICTACVLREDNSTSKHIIEAVKSIHQGKEIATNHDAENLQQQTVFVQGQELPQAAKATAAADLISRHPQPQQQQ